jgi:hypothetical protein
MLKRTKFDSVCSFSSMNEIHELGLMLNYDFIAWLQDNIPW